MIANGGQDGQFGDNDDVKVMLPDVHKNNKRTSINKTHLRAKITSPISKF